MYREQNLSASKFQNPIYLETPRLRKFYETTLTSLDSCSPLLGSSRPLILQNLLQSDCKCNPQQRINLSNAKLQKALMDPLGEIELNHSDGKTCLEDENEELEVGLLGINKEIRRKLTGGTIIPQTQQSQQQQQQQHHQHLLQQQLKQQQQQQQQQQQVSEICSKKIFKIYHCDKAINTSSYQTKGKEISEIEKMGSNEFNEQMVNIEDRDNSELKNEVKKRMRKSNQQLKILKVEFDKSGFWGKDKITQVANITGLTESQVYKWCWDQKKKQVEIGCDSITKKIFKSKYKSNKSLQQYQQQQMDSINKIVNQEQFTNDHQDVSKRLSFE